MKIGSRPEDDARRVRVAQKRPSGRASLFVDANGAYSREAGAATWLTFSPPTRRLPGLKSPSPPMTWTAWRKCGRRRLRAWTLRPASIRYNCDDVRHMLTRRAVDVQQVDASRCLGITGFLRAGALCDAHHIDLSGHCAPALHLHAACAVPRLRHLEWFHDHVRIEHMLFDGAPSPRTARLSQI